MATNDWTDVPDDGSFQDNGGWADVSTSIEESPNWKNIPNGRTVSAMMKSHGDNGMVAVPGRKIVVESIDNATGKRIKGEKIKGKFVPETEVQGTVDNITKQDQFRLNQKTLAQSPAWKSATPEQKQMMMAQLLEDNGQGTGFVAAAQKSQYQPEGLGKTMLRKAMRYVPATAGGLLAGGSATLASAGVGTIPATAAGAMGGYALGKSAEEAMLGTEPVPPPKERLFKGGTLSQGLAEAIYNVPESASNLAEGAIAFPSQLSKAVMTPGGGAQVVKDTAHMIGAPLGLYGSDAAKDAWVLDPAGSAAGVGMAYGGIKGLKGEGGVTEARINSYIAKKFPNAAGMSTSGMERSPDFKNHITDAQGAIKTITALKDEGKIKVGDLGAEEVRVPKSRSEFADAIYQAKNYVFNVYNSLKQKAGEAGVKIDTSPVQSELKSIGDDPGLRVMRPEIINYATELSNRLVTEGALTPDAANSIIKSANDSYKNFLKNPSYESGGRAVVDALIANHLRKAMEKSIESEVGPGWQAYRNKYKQLSTIEKEVTKGAVVDARKSPIGLLDFTDMFSAGEAVSGIISMNPAQFAKGGTMFMIKRIYKKFRDPNTAVEKMFRMTDKHYKRPSPMSTEPWIGYVDKPEPLDTSFNPETPGQKGTDTGFGVIPGGNHAPGLEEGGYRFEQPQTIQRQQTVLNPEYGATGITQHIEREAGVPNGIGLEEGGVPPEIMTKPRVSDPERLPGRQSSYTDQEMVPQGNTNVALISMATKLKELGFTDEQIAQFKPKAMKLGTTAALASLYALADEDTKKKMAGVTGLALTTGLGRKPKVFILPDSIRPAFENAFKNHFTTLSPKEVKNTRLVRLDKKGYSPKIGGEFKPSEFATTSETWKPNGKFYSDNLQDAGVLSGDLITDIPYPSKGKTVKEQISKDYNQHVDNYNSENPYPFSSIFETSHGKPAKDAKVLSIDESTLKTFANEWAPSKTAMTEMLQEKGVTHLVIKNVDGMTGVKEIIQIEPKTSKIRGRKIDGGLYGIGGLSILTGTYQSKKEN